MIDYLEIIDRGLVWMEDQDATTYPPDSDGAALAAIKQAVADVRRLRKIEEAARKHVAAKGRYNTEQTYLKLVEACK